MTAHGTVAPQVLRDRASVPRRPADDERLAALVGEGDDRAFTVLYERYHQRLYGYCLSLLRDDSDAQDALQSAFAGALAALRRGQRNAPVRPWLFKIAHNEAISLIRRRRPEAERPVVRERPDASRSVPASAPGSRCWWRTCASCPSDSEARS
jgi:DNA-directed RNA polymerase specialized sigma24 family protein